MSRLAARLKRLEAKLALPPPDPEPEELPSAWLHRLLTALKHAGLDEPSIDPALAVLAEYQSYRGRAVDLSAGKPGTHMEYYIDAKRGHVAAAMDGWCARDTVIGHCTDATPEERVDAAFKCLFSTDMTGLDLAGHLRQCLDIETVSDRPARELTGEELARIG
jgi:hypothetical protein